MATETKETNSQTYDETKQITESEESNVETDNETDDEEKSGWPEPVDLYSDKDPKHLTAKKIRMAIKNFLEPEAAETLAHLSNFTLEDLLDGYSTRCQCGCYDRSTILDAFDNADLESLKFIVERKLLHPAMLCHILSKIFSYAGTLAYPHRLAYEAKLKGIDFDKEHTGLCDGWINLANANIEYLLDYLCTNHADLVRQWRGTPTYRAAKSVSKAKSESVDANEYQTPTLLHCAFYGHTDDDTQKRWVQKLLDVGCNPFAYYNYAAGNYDTPFRYMLTNLYYDMANEVAYQKTPEELRDLINLIDGFEKRYDNENVLMHILDKFKHTKKPQWVLELLATIDLVFKLGINVNHLDKYNRNVSDYIEQYGYAELLKERIAQYNLPPKTGNVKPKSKWAEQSDNAETHNPSKFASLFYKYRMAKTEDELDAFRKEYDTLIAELGPLTSEQLDDQGPRHEYESLSSLMHRWGFNSILTKDSA